MEGYSYSYPTPYPMRTPDGAYPDHGDGYGEYYGLGPLNEDRTRRSRSKPRARRSKESKRSRSRSVSETKSRSQSHSRSRSRSRSKSRSRSRSRSQSRARTQTRSRSRSVNRQKEFNYKEPSFLDAFRVLYLSPSRTRKNPSRYLATQKRQDRIEEILKSDGLGSKHWLFYPRQKTVTEPALENAGCRENCDQRIKVDGDFFRKYKRSKKIDHDAPIAKLKRWELVFYKKLGFIQAV